jgi:hypothetical protein
MNKSLLVYIAWPDVLTALHAEILLRINCYRPSSNIKIMVK